MNGRLKSGMRLAALLALLVALQGCTMLRLGYSQIDVYALWTASDYFDLDRQQRLEFERRFDRLHDWHRYEQLPDYVAFLDASRARLQRGIRRDDVLWIIDGIQKRYRTVVSHGADDAAAMLLTVTPAQIEHLKRKWERDNRRFEREYRIQEGPEAQRNARMRRLYDRINDWTGTLTVEQEAKIAVMVRDWPIIHPLRYEDRVRRQKEFLALLAQRGDARQFTEKLRHWLTHWEEGRDPEYARLFRDWEQKQADLYVAVAGMLNEHQKATTLGRIQGYMDDFTRLSQKQGAASPGGHCCGDTMKK